MSSGPGSCCWRQRVGPTGTIGETVGLHYNQVGLWRKRYEQFGMGGLVDEDRPGRPAVYDHDDVLLLVKLVTEPPPDQATRWSMEALAQAMADHGVPISASQAWRICKSLDLKPWQVESWMTSHDPDFWAKASDVCGLYLDPPENAVVWSVDEKSGMQAKSRVNPTKPAVPGKPARWEFEYKRNGTAVLFAALDVHDGGFRRLGHRLDQVRELRGPSSVTSCARHPKASTCTASPTTSRPTRPAGRRLPGQEPSCAHPLHTHPCQLVEPGGVVLLHPWSAGSASGASSLPSTIWPAGSSHSSTTTTKGRPVPLDLRRSTLKVA